MLIMHAFTEMRYNYVGTRPWFSKQRDHYENAMDCSKHIQKQYVATRAFKTTLIDVCSTKIKDK